MLESLRLINVQSHERLDIKFSPTVTSIVGPSDVGKTAILRALRFICLNEAAGGLPRHGTKRTVVRMVIDGVSVTRKRSGAGNSYALDGKRYDAVRHDVPPRIRNHLKIGVFNFQCQHDGPFWLSDSAGSVSRELNEIVDLAVIDRTLANVATRYRTAQADYRITEQRFQRAKEEVRELAWVKACQAEVEDLQAKEKALGKLCQQVADLSAAVAKASAAVQARRHGLARLQTALSVALAAKAAYKAVKARKGLQNTLQQALQAQRQAALAPPSHHKLGFALQHREDLEALITKLEEQETNKWRLQKQLAISSRQLEKRSKGRCPICGSKIRR
jgi:DNA repair exonuclease SbcCD ATPase subunit